MHLGIICANCLCKLGYLTLYYSLAIDFSYLDIKLLLVLGTGNSFPQNPSLEGIFNIVNQIFFCSIIYTICIFLKKSFFAAKLQRYSFLFDQFYCFTFHIWVFKPSEVHLTIVKGVCGLQKALIVCNVSLLNDIY